MAYSLNVSIGYNAGGSTLLEGGGQADILFLRQDDSVSGFPPFYVGVRRIYFTLTGTAVRGVDYLVYLSDGTTVTTNNYADVPDGQQYYYLKIAALTDAITEGSETIIVTLVPDAAYTLGGDGGPTTTLTYTITGVAIPTVGVISKPGNPQDAAEPATNKYFRIISVDPAAPWNQLAVTANTTVYYTMGGTATSGVDYTALSGSAVIPSGQSYVDVLLAVIDDAIAEQTEIAALYITANAGYLISGLNPSYEMLIFDNEVDQVFQSVYITFGQTTIQETADTHYNQTIVSVLITQAITTNLVVPFTLTGTAVRGVDYNIKVNGTDTIYSGPLEFTFTPSNEMLLSLKIDAINDSIYKGNRTVIAAITSTIFYSIIPQGSIYLGTDTLTILEDEVATVVVVPTDPADPGSPDYPVIPSTVVDTVVETVNEFTEVSSIIKSEPSECDIIVTDADGNLLARIPNNELASVYQIVDVSELPWTTSSESAIDHYVEVLYKKSLTNFVNNTDEFPAIGYDNIIVNKMMQLWAEEQGNGKAAMAYDQKATRSLARKNEEENRATVDVIAFVDNPHDSLYRRLKKNLFVRR